MGDGDELKCNYLGDSCLAVHTYGLRRPGPSRPDVRCTEHRTESSTVCRAQGAVCRHVGLLPELNGLSFETGRSKADIVK